MSLKKSGRDYRNRPLNKSDKEWIDAYNTQIKRIVRDRSNYSLTPVERRILKMLVERYIEISINYIFRKYCKL
ncbi:MAG: hypothetical protein AABY15_01765 [Nanoarchaeota archaeon]